MKTRPVSFIKYFKQFLFKRYSFESNLVTLSQKVHIGENYMFFNDIFMVTGPWKLGHIHISRLDDIGCKHLTSGDGLLKRVQWKTPQYPCFFIPFNVKIEIIYYYLSIIAY